MKYWYLKKKIYWKLGNEFIFLCLIFSDTLFLRCFLQFISPTQSADNSVCYYKFAWEMWVKFGFFFF